MSYDGEYMKTTLSIWLVLVLCVFSNLEISHAAALNDSEIAPAYALPKRYTELQYAVAAGGHTSVACESIQGLDVHFMMLSKGYKLFDTSSAHVHFRPEVAYYQSVSPNARGMFTGTISGVLYPFEAEGVFSPFIELTFGGTYTDYDIDKQGTSWNFLTGGGIGADFTINAVPIFISGRYAHISNAGLSCHNGGFNWIACIIGVYF